MINVAIDGPAGAGKSTIARRAAEKLGYIYVDTGALYRAVGLKFSKTGADISSDKDIERVLSGTAVDIRFSGGEQHVFFRRRGRIGSYTHARSLNDGVGGFGKARRKGVFA